MADNHHHHRDDVAATHDFVKANEAHYDAEAEQIDSRPEWKQLAHDACEAMLKAYPDLLDKNKTEVMDYACGPGLVSRELFPHVKSILGVDISQGVVDVFNRRVSEQGIAPEAMRAVRAMLKGEDTELNGAKFDVIVCTAAYHHFPDVNETTRVLATFLKPGGSLVITDLLPPKEGGTEMKKEILEKVAHVVPHHGGFTKDDMYAVFEKAGLASADYRFATEATAHGNKISFFIARAVKQ